MSSLRLEKGYRDIGVDIDNTDNPIKAGLGFTIAWDKPGGFVGRHALQEFKARGPASNRVVSLLVDDPSADLFGNEGLPETGCASRNLRFRHQPAIFRRDCCFSRSTTLRAHASSTRKPETVAPQLGDVPHLARAYPSGRRALLCQPTLVN
jgi:hypothetical protein